MRARRLQAALADLSALDFWPAFDPAGAPLAVYDGAQTVLLGHPGAPAGFGAAGSDGTRACPGRHPAVAGNSAVLFAGVPTATLVASGRTPTRRLVALAAHEAFHAFQMVRFPNWAADEGALFAYPADDPMLLALARLEAAALARALGDPASGAGWAKAFLAARAGRFAAMGTDAVAYERATELVEGTARYVELRALGRPSPFGRRAVVPDHARARMYATGAALAFLLDAFEPGWKGRLGAGSADPLDALLADAVVGVPGTAAFSEADRSRARAAAAAQARRIVKGRAARLAALRDAPGWRLIVEAAPGEPLTVRGFDPMNAEPVKTGLVLHGRYLELGNAAGGLSVVGRTALTDAAGEHPLFGGVTCVEVPGLPACPVAEQKDGRVALTSGGLDGAFAAAGVAVAGKTATVRLGAAGHVATDDGRAYASDG